MKTLFSIIINQRKLVGFWGVALTVFYLYMRGEPPTVRYMHVRSIVCLIVFLYGLISVGIVASNDKKISIVHKLFVLYGLLLSVSAVMMYFITGRYVNSLSAWSHQMKLCLLYLLFTQCASFIIYFIALFKNFNRWQIVVLLVIAITILVTTYLSLNYRWMGLPPIVLLVVGISNLILCKLLNFSKKNQLITICDNLCVLCAFVSLC